MTRHTAPGDDLLRSPLIQENQLNLNELQPADIVLFQVPHTRDSLVSRFQAAIAYPDVANRIVHAALYLGHGVIAHSTPFDASKLRFGGIHIERLSDNISSKYTPYALRDPSLAIDQRLRIALFAATYGRRGAHYDYKQIIRCIFALADRHSSERAEGELPNIVSPLQQFFLKKSIIGPKGATHEAEVTDPEDAIGAYWANTVATLDTEGVLNPHGGAASFVCSDFVLHCYSKILREKNSLTQNNSGTPSPIYLPADIFENTRFVSVGSKSHGTEDIDQDISKAQPKVKAGLKGQH